MGQDYHDVPTGRENSLPKKNGPLDRNNPLSTSPPRFPGEIPVGIHRNGQDLLQNYVNVCTCKLLNPQIPDVSLWDRTTTMCLRGGRTRFRKS